ncbi:MAG: D-alanyl-D-alanine carboxypeptidase [Verrucomicrobiales bacterium]|nr:D-alanyl-D-alanine carboxypeptidase [Verrucomicrobiales bacterium]
MNRFFPKTIQQGLFGERTLSVRTALLGAVAMLGVSGCKTGGGFAGGGDLPAAPYHPAPVGQQGTQPQPGAASGPTLANHRVQRGVPNITARAAILVDARTGRILYQKNIDQRVPVASTQKLLLGLMMVESGNLGRTITVQKSDTWAEPTIMGIKPGQTYRKDELLKAVLVRSSNDIARCLARDQFGSVSGFANAANRRARQLGMVNSYFTNASGLPDPPGQYSTARDLAILAAAAMQHRFIRDAVSTRSMTFRFSDGRTKAITNTNQVLRTYPYCTGAKTGYTNAAGRCLISTAERGNKSVIAVILGSKTPNVWSESQGLLQWGLGM